MKTTTTCILCLLATIAVGDAWRPGSFVKPTPITEGGKPLDKAGFIRSIGVLSSCIGVTAAVDDDPRSSLQDYKSSFNYSKVEEKPGYFSAYLEDNQVKVDVTAAKNVAAYRFTFPASEKGCHVVLDISQPLDRFEGGEIKVRDGKTLEGFGMYDGTKIYFSFQFTEPIRRRGVWEGDSQLNRHFAGVGSGSALGFYAYFWNTHEGETLLMKVGVSTKSIGDARENLAKEFPGWDFKQLSKESGQAW